MYYHRPLRQVSLANHRSVLDSTPPPERLQPIDLDLPADDDAAVAIVHRFVQLRREAPRVPLPILARMAHDVIDREPGEPAPGLARPSHGHADPTQEAE